MEELKIRIERTRSNAHKLFEREREREREREGGGGGEMERESTRCTHQYNQNPQVCVTYIMM